MQGDVAATILLNETGTFLVTILFNRAGRHD